MLDNTRIRQLAHQHLTGAGDHCIINFARALIEEAARSTIAAPTQEPTQYGCHCDLESGMTPDACVIDDGRRDDCVYARRHERKEQCIYWKPISAAAPIYTVAPAVPEGGVGC